MAIFFMLAASACFVTMSAIVKAMGQSLPLTELMFLRCLIALPFLLIFQLKGSKPLVTKAWDILLIRSLFGSMAMFCFYYALTHIPLADCVFIGRTQPLILAILSPFLIGEKAPRIVWLSIGLGLLGISLIMRPALVWSSGAWMALVASSAAAVAHLMIRRLGRTDDPPVIVFNFTLILALISGLACYFVFIWPTPEQWLYLAGIAFFASSGQYLLTMAYACGKAPAVAASSYSSVILSVIYGYFFWGELPSGYVFVGGGFIIVGGLLLVNSRYHVSEPARKQS